MSVRGKAKQLSTRTDNIHTPNPLPRRRRLPTQPHAHRQTRPARKRHTTPMNGGDVLKTHTASTSFRAGPTTFVVVAAAAPAPPPSRRGRGAGNLPRCRSRHQCSSSYLPTPSPLLARPLGADNGKAGRICHRHRCSRRAPSSSPLKSGRGADNLRRHRHRRRPCSILLLSCAGLGPAIFLVAAAATHAPSLPFRRPAFCWRSLVCQGRESVRHLTSPTVAVTIGGDGLDGWQRK